MAREYKDSGIEWIGQIPKEWSTERIKTIFSERSELSDSGSEELLSVSEYYGVASRKEKIDDGEFVSRAESLVGYKKCFKGDLVSNIMLAWKGSLGVTNTDGIVSPAYCVYKPSSSIYPAYYHYLFRTSLYTSIFRLYSKGIIDSRLRLYSPYFFNIMTLIPPLSEQQKIADYLDKVCGEADEMIALQEKMIEELKAYKQSVITEAVTKGLNPNVLMKDSGIEWIGEIPEHWNVTKIKMIAKTNSGSTPRSISNDDNADIVWIRTTDINDDVVTKSSIHLTKTEFSSASCPMLDKGTCVVAMYGGGGTIGKSGLLGIRATINQALCSMETYDSYFSEYLFCVLKAIRYEWMKWAVGTRKDPNISQEIVKNQIIPFPPVNEQRQIAAFLDSKCSDIDSLIAVKQQKIEELKEYKKSVIYEYVTGKKEVI